MYVLLSISGKDRTGIVRDVAGALLNIDASIEDSTMTALRGRFTMMLIVHLAEKSSLGELKAALSDLEQRTDLIVQSQSISEEEVASVPKEPDCVITVSGANRPGIVHAVSDILARCGAEIVDVSTQSRVSGEGGDLYMMALEVVAGSAVDELRSSIQDSAGKLGIEIHIHELEAGIL